MAIRPLRILHTEASQGWGGQEIRILTESAGMIQRGHTVQLVCGPDAGIHRVAPQYGVPSHPLPIHKKRLQGLLALRRWLAAHPQDVIITHSSTDSWLAALAVQSLGAATPLIRVRHISAPVTDNLPTRWLYTRASRHVITTGERLREALIRHNRFPPGQVTSIPTGIDLSRYHPAADPQAARAALGLPQDRPLMGIVATLRSWKGHHVLLAAMTRMQRQDAHLVVVGHGPRWDYLHEMIARLGLQQRVTMVGNQADVVPWLHAFHLFTLPSTANEGVPQGLMQAMACGLPVVTTPVGSIGELVRDGVTGMVVPPEQPEPLARVLDRVLMEPALAGRLARQGRAHVAQHFSLPAMLDRTEALLERVCGG